MISKINNITLDELMKEENEGKVLNDSNNTNSQKLAGMTIKILKGIGIFLLISVILYVALIVVGFIAFNRVGTDGSSKRTVIQMQEEVDNYEE